MNRSFRVLIPAFAVVAVACFSCLSRSDGDDPVARGRYLVTAMGCNDCHTPWHIGENGPAPNPALLLSGHPGGVTLPPAPEGNADWPVAVSATNTAWSGPWGTSFTANLTPDREHGIGAWTVDEFIGAIRTGRHQGRGRQILPPMPYEMIRTLTDEDLGAIFAYLQSIPAIANKVPEPLPPRAN